MDDAADLASVELAPGKARTAALFKKPSQALEDAIPTVALLPLRRTPFDAADEGDLVGSGFRRKQEEVLHGSVDDRRRRPPQTGQGGCSIGQRAFTSAKSMNDNAALLFVRNQAAFDLTIPNRWLYCIRRGHGRMVLWNIPLGPFSRWSGLLFFWCFSSKTGRPKWARISFPG
jgi:hypothetical protein